MLRGVWQALNCLSIHATYCVIVAGASPGETKMWAAVRENGVFLHLQFEYLGNCWRYMGICCETLAAYTHVSRQFVSIEFSLHPYNIYHDCPRGVFRGNQNVVKIAIFGLTHRLKHRITRKLLKTDRYMLRGVWQALNCLFIHATHCVIVAGESLGETKMWAAVRENGVFLHLRFEYLGNCWKYIATCCEIICKHRILFPSIQH